MDKKLGKILSFFAVAANLTAGGIDFADFENPARENSPWVYWMWVNGNVDKESITDDMQAMDYMGVGGTLMFDNRGYWEDDRHLLYPKPANTNLDPSWLANLTHAVNESKRLGLKMSINLSNCGGNLKGPHKTLADAPKKIVFKTIPVSGKFDNTLPVPPEKFSKPIATFAIKYDGGKMQKESDWIAGGDGLFTMAATSGKRLDKGIDKIRNALEVVDLTDKIKNGKLEWQAPADGGDWAVLQISYATMDDREFDVDILDPAAIERHYERWAGSFRKCFGKEFGKTVERFYNVSWEGSIPTWTNNFEEYFKRDRGYDIRPWLPYLGGFVVKNKEQSERFMTDFRRARNNCLLGNFYAKIGELAHRDGVQWHSESGGPWIRKPEVFGEADQLAFLGINDMPQGEFWVEFPYDDPRKYGRYLVHPIASAAHIYGSNLVAMESFTHMSNHWSMYPGILKFYADRSFVQGVNFSILHTFTSSPKRFGLPGIEYFAGTHFNQNVTWHKQSPEFIKYMARCQFLLRYGKPQSDFCLYEGDVPYEGWYGTNCWNGFRVYDKKRAYDYYPLKFDTVNNDVLLNGAKVADGKLVLKSGMQYKAMFIDIPSNSVSPKALAKILEFKKQGLPVFCSSAPKPTTAAGLGEDCDAVSKLADQIWDGGDFGEFAKTLRPACEGDFEYIVRRGENDVFFLAGEGKGRAAFDAAGIPELWDAVEGKKYSPDSWKKLPDGRTEIELNLPKNGSIFVVFTGNSQAKTKPVAPAKSLELGGEWTVEFPEGLGAPKSIKLDKLADLTTHENFGVRHFAGTATYKKSFDLQTLPKRAQLDLEKVNYVAEVYVNGQKAATLWCYPFSCDISKFLKQGENSLEIKVVNTWQNRLIGDCKVPESERITRSNVRTRPTERGNHTIFSGFAKDDKLIPSGLVGKVVVRYE